MSIIRRSSDFNIGHASLLSLPNWYRWCACASRDPVWTLVYSPHSLKALIGSRRVCRTPQSIVCHYPLRTYSRYPLSALFWSPYLHPARTITRFRLPSTWSQGHTPQCTSTMQCLPLCIPHADRRGRLVPFSTQLNFRTLASVGLRLIPSSGTQPWAANRRSLG